MNLNRREFVGATVGFLLCPKPTVKAVEKNPIIELPYLRIAHESSIRKTIWQSLETIDPRTFYLQQQDVVRPLGSTVRLTFISFRHKAMRWNSVDGTTIVTYDRNSPEYIDIKNAKRKIQLPNGWEINMVGAEALIQIGDQQALWSMVSRSTLAIVLEPSCKEGRTVTIGLGGKKMFFPVLLDPAPTFEPFRLV